MMATYLAYVDAVPGRLYPLVPTLLELKGRGHQVTVKAGIDDIERLRSVGLHAEPLAPPIERFEPDDWKARTRFGALMSGLRQFGERAHSQADDLAHTIADLQPDALFIDEGAWGAAAAAERSGLPWAFSLVSAIPLTSRDAPPFGLGLRPRHDAVGRLRDRVLGRLTLGTLERIIASHLNPLRTQLNLPPFSKIDQFYLVADLVITFTAEPFEYPRSDWPSKVRLVGPGLWEPPAEPPAWLADVHRPLVLVTCSTLFQNDRKIAQIACEAFDGEPIDAVITTVEIDPATFTPPPNVRIERFVPHSPVLEHAACVVCHAGMGITQKALAHGVPVVAIPFGRDQPEVARRVEVAGAGVRLPAHKLNPTRLRTAVRDAINLRPGAQRIAAAFAAAGGPTAAADALETLTRTPAHA
jgi:MGT family glycosyltransferase